MKRFITMVAIAATAIAAMAAIAAGPASAGTVLCKTPTTTCASADILPKGSYFTNGWNSGGGFEIKEGSTVRLSCNGNGLSGKTDLRNGNPLTGKFGGEAGSCSGFGFTSCGTATMNQPAVTYSAGLSGSGTMIIGSTSEPLAITIKCASIFGEANCVFTAKGAVNLVSSGSTAKITNAAMTVKGGAVLCGESVVLNVTKNVVASEEYISTATETVICKTPRSTASPCPNADILPAGNGFGISVTKFTITSGSTKSLSCEQGKGFDGGLLGFGSTAEAGSPLPAASENGVSSGCTIGPSISCTSVDLSDPASTLVSNSTSSSTVTLGSASEPFTVAFSCPTTFLGVIKCTYAATGGVPINISSGFPNATITNAPMKRTSSDAGAGFCPAEDVLNMVGHAPSDQNSISII